MGRERESERDSILAQNLVFFESIHGGRQDLYRKRWMQKGRQTPSRTGLLILFDMR